MSKILTTLSLLLVSGMTLAQTQPGVPEIDAAAGTGALALLVGAVALLRERRRR